MSAVARMQCGGWLMLGTLTLATCAGCLPAAPPEPLTPADGAQVAGTTATLRVHASPSLWQSREITFYGRKQAPPGDDFVFVALPDTQYYSAAFPETFLAQTNYVIAQRAADNIAGVFHLGDIVDFAGAESQWENADAALAVLDAEPDLPYGLCVGNHDELPNGYPGGTEAFNRWFPVERYADRPWYGGHFGDNNDNHYILISAGGLDFVVVFMSFNPNPDPAVLAWADAVLKQHADRRAIVCAHNMVWPWFLAGAFSPQGVVLHDRLKDNPNLFLMLGGHMCDTGGRFELDGGRIVYALVSDYQCLPGGGAGWLRRLEFSPRNNTLHVRTYSPTLGGWHKGELDDFVLPYDMSDGTPFVEIGRATPDATGAAQVTWTGLTAGQSYEWCAVSAGESRPPTERGWWFTAAP